MLNDTDLVAVGVSLNAIVITIVNRLMVVAGLDLSVVLKI